MRASLIILSCSLAAVTAIPVHAQNAQSVRLGEAALTYAAGSIRQEMPIDGVINVITGDNQLSGNRMMLGWSGTDTLYLKLKNPGDAALGDLYTVYRRSRKVFHPMTKQYMGYIINRGGESHSDRRGTGWRPGCSVLWSPLPWRSGHAVYTAFSRRSR